MKIAPDDKPPVAARPRAVEADVVGEFRVLRQVDRPRAVEVRPGLLDLQPHGQAVAKANEAVAQTQTRPAKRNPKRQQPGQKRNHLVPSEATKRRPHSQWGMRPIRSLTPLPAAS